MLRSKFLVFTTAILLTGCVTKSQISNMEGDINQVAEKVDSLLIHSNNTNDMLADMDLRMDTLEQDARKRGVPTRVKGTDIANNTAPAPYPYHAPKPAQVSKEQSNLPVKDAKISDDRKIGGQHYLPEGMSYGQKSDNSKNLNFPKDAETNNVASQNVQPSNQNSNMGTITGQDLTRLNQNQSQAGAPQVSGQLVASTPPKATSNFTPLTPSVSRHSPNPANYDYALNLYKQAKYQEAEQAFNAFLQANPQGVLAPNALYWKGETYYARGDYPNAIFTFKEVQTRYPKHSKAADSLLKTGMSYAKLGDVNNANLHYTVLQEDFPNSNAARQIPKI